jgi:hypothetical protein
MVIGPSQPTERCHIAMLRVILPWSQANIPGITAKIAGDTALTTDPIITVSHAAVAEVRAIFAAFCASWQQGDRKGCELLRPLLAAHGIVPAITL